MSFSYPFVAAFRSGRESTGLEETPLVCLEVRLKSSDIVAARELSGRKTKGDFRVGTTGSPFEKLSLQPTEDDFAERFRL